MQLSPSSLPFEENVVFKDSSFFKQEKHITLPPLADVRAATDVKDPRYGTNRAQITHFPSLRLTVKWGREVTIAEGQCLWAIRRQLSGAVPVPELYGWCREGNAVYIYMEMVPGVTLEERWDNLSPDERSQVCEQLRGIVAALGSLEQDPDDKFIGNVAKQPLLDVIFTSSCSPPAGPFPDVTSFLDFFAHLPHTYDRTSGEPPHPMRSQLIDKVPIKFTHGDLCRSNIMLYLTGR